jgi:hypothetical protein
MAKKDELAAKIVEEEWKIFSSVPNIGGKASCQEDYKAFEINRSSQVMNWSPETMESYLQDLAEAEKEGRNLMTEKYARMMKSTSPAEYAAIEHHLPPVDNESLPIIDEIAGIVLAWEDALSKKYPNVFKKGRPLYSSGDSKYVTSLETYLRGELATYSLRTLKLFYDDVAKQQTDNINGSEIIMDTMMKRFGYSSLQDADEKIKHGAQSK